MKYPPSLDWTSNKCGESERFAVFVYNIQVLSPGCCHGNSTKLTLSALMSELSDFLQHLVRLQLLQSQQRQAELVLLQRGRRQGTRQLSLPAQRDEPYLFEGLSHLPQEVFGELHGLVHGEVQAAVADVFLDPARKLPAFVCSSVTLQRRQEVTSGSDRFTGT